MGAQASVPKPGAEFQVIGAGMSRTGTSSFSEALSILLDEPVHHCGTQQTTPPHSHAVSQIQKEQLDGYVAVTDAPANGLVDEILQIHPKAKVICTTRDIDSWVKSTDTIQSATTMNFLAFILFLTPGMRHFTAFVEGLVKQWRHQFGHEGVTKRTYEMQIEYLKRVVPEEQLFFFDVMEGWEPLCKALGKEVPKGWPFPRINDAEAIDKRAEELIVQGLMRWTAVLRLRRGFLRGDDGWEKGECMDVLIKAVKEVTQQARVRSNRRRSVSKDCTRRWGCIYYISCPKIQNSQITNPLLSSSPTSPQKKEQKLSLFTKPIHPTKIKCFPHLCM